MFPLISDLFDWDLYTPYDYDDYLNEPTYNNMFLRGLAIYRRKLQLMGVYPRIYEYDGELYDVFYKDPDYDFDDLMGFDPELYYEYEYVNLKPRKMFTKSTKPVQKRRPSKQKRKKGKQTKLVSSKRQPKKLGSNSLKKKEQRRISSGLIPTSNDSPGIGPTVTTTEGTLTSTKDNFLQGDGSSHFSTMDPIASATAFTTHSEAELSTENIKQILRALFASTTASTTESIQQIPGDIIASLASTTHSVVDFSTESTKQIPRASFASTTQSTTESTQQIPGDSIVSTTASTTESVQQIAGELFASTAPSIRENEMEMRTIEHFTPIHILPTNSYENGESRTNDQLTTEHSNKDFEESSSDLPTVTHDQIVTEDLKVQIKNVFYTTTDVPATIQSSFSFERTSNHDVSLTTIEPNTAEKPPANNYATPKMPRRSDVLINEDEDNKPEEYDESIFAEIFQKQYFYNDHKKPPLTTEPIPMSKEMPTTTLLSTTTEAPQTPSTVSLNRVSVTDSTSTGPIREQKMDTIDGRSLFHEFDISQWIPVLIQQIKLGRITHDEQMALKTLFPSQWKEIQRKIKMNDFIVNDVDPMLRRILETNNKKKVVSH